MANFQVGPKVVVINNPADFPLVSHTKNANGAYVRDAVFSANAHRIVVEGFAQLDGGKTKNMVLTRGVAGQPQVSTVTFGGALYQAGDLVYITINARSENLEADFQRPDGTYVKEQTYQLMVRAGEGANQLAARLNLLIGLDAALGRNIVTSAVAGPVVTLTGLGNGIRFTATAAGIPITNGNITVAAVVTQVAFEGRNTWLQLNRLRPQTPARMTPYGGIDAREIPLPGILYTSFHVTKSVERPDLQGDTTANGDVTAKFSYEIYLNQTTCAAAIANLILWGDQNADIFVKYNATTPALALAQPELIVKEANKLVTNITITSAGNVVQLAVGNALQMTAGITPADAQIATVTWSTSNAAFATVDAAGLVTAVAVGIVIITATANDDSGVIDTFELLIIP
jgi:hypothetical protein